MCNGCKWTLKGDLKDHSKIVMKIRLINRNIENVSLTIVSGTLTKMSKNPEQINL